MKKREIARMVAIKHGLTNVDAYNIVSSTFNFIEKAILEDNSVALGGFGTFRLVMRKASRIQDIKSKEKVSVPPMKILKYRMGKRFKAKLIIKRKEEAPSIAEGLKKGV